MKAYQRLRELSEKYTDLSDAEIARLENIARLSEVDDSYQDVDVFIDVFSEIYNEALVVFHKKPLHSSSLYKQEVVGKKALWYNEPGAFRALQTGVGSEGILATSQENTLVKQVNVPIFYADKIIGTLITEVVYDEEKAALSDKEISQGLSSNVKILAHLDGQIPESILIYNNRGKLVKHNKMAKNLYKKLGFKENLIGMDFDNFSLGNFRYKEIIQKLLKQPEGVLEKEVGYHHHFFQIRWILDKLDNKLITIICDVSEIRKKEMEIISKNVAIQEIHHRVKNNLQSIVSLLRIQSRRTENEGAKKVLGESVSRIMAIAKTHELLSKQIGDKARLDETIQSICAHFIPLLAKEKQVAFSIDIQSDIFIRSDDMVTISLIVNELIQNIYDHAFPEIKKGRVMLAGFRKNDIIQIEVTDNGVGYDVSKRKKNSLGLMIIESYVRDKLKGKLEIKSNKNGTQTVFCFGLEDKDVFHR